MTVVYYLLTVLIGTFSLGLGILVFFKSGKNRVIAEYLIFYVLISIRLFFWLVYAYLMMIKGHEFVLSLVFLYFIDITMYLILWAIPRFIHAFFNVGFGRIVNYISLFIALCFTLDFILGYHLKLYSLRFIISGTSLFHILYIFFIVYAIVIGFIYLRRIENRLHRKLGLIFLVLSTISLPLLIIDVIPFDVKPFGYVMLTPLYYIVLTGFSLYYAVKFYLLPRAAEPGLSEKFIIEFGISDREKEIILLMLENISNKEIAERAFISVATVKTHIYNIYRKTGIKSRNEFVSLLRQYG